MPKFYIVEKYIILAFDIYATKKILSKICSVNSKIIKNTICAINNKILFATNDGVKLFDGNDYENFFVDLPMKIDFKFDKTFAFAYCGKYYFSANVHIDGAYQNCLICCDVETKNVTVLNFAKNINNYVILQNSVEYKLLISCGNDENIEILSINDCEGNKLKYYLKFNKIYLDNHENKQIDSIKFCSTGSFYLKIISDKDEIEFKVSEYKKDFCNLFIKGHLFEFEVYSDECFCIDSLAAEITSFEDNL